MNGQEFYIRERSPYKKKIKPKNYQDVEITLQQHHLWGKLPLKYMHELTSIILMFLPITARRRFLKAIGKERNVFIEHTILQAMSYKETVYTDYDLFKTGLKQK